MKRQRTQTETQEAPAENQESFLTPRVSKHWHRLPREVTESSCLEIFTVCLEMVLGNKIQMAQLEQGAWT